MGLESRRTALTPDQLRAQAGEYREAARATNMPGIVASLLRLAERLEQLAAKQEAADRNSQGGTARPIDGP